MNFSSLAIFLATFQVLRNKHRITSRYNCKVNPPRLLNNVAFSEVTHGGVDVMDTNQGLRKIRMQAATLICEQIEDIITKHSSRTILSKKKDLDEMVAELQYYGVDPSSLLIYNWARLVTTLDCIQLRFNYDISNRDTTGVNQIGTIKRVRRVLCASSSDFAGLFPNPAVLTLPSTSEIGRLDNKFLADIVIWLLLFGGHGTGGWLSRYDIYYNDCIILDRVSAQLKRLPTGNESPPSRVYHSLTCIGSRHLLFGGFDGKSTFGDLWRLVPGVTAGMRLC
ncbi:PREDICTED: uncharacterized protein LOC101303339 [Fragaria vesca subsp. vesca]